MRLITRRRDARVSSLSTALAAVVLFVSVGFGSGCRSHEGFRKQYLTQLRPHMVKGDFRKAADVTKASKDKLYEEEDRVMYWLNLATLLHYAGRYDESSTHFVKAEETMQDLWTKSISEEASKFLANETIQDYPGEDFEKILVFYYTALNELEQGNLQDALVEARRADEFLKKIQVQYEKEKAEVGTLYKQDAFMLWLVGLFYEMEGSWSDAFLAYQTAYDAYQKEYAGKFGAPAPSFLKEDLIRTAQLAGRTDKLAELGEGGQTLTAASEGMAEVIVLHGSGEAPYKEQTFIQGPMPDGYVMRIAIPKFAATKHKIVGARVRVAGQQADTELVEPIQRIALDNYQHRLPAITARAIARATIKYVASKGAEKAVKGNGNDSKRALAGALVGLFANVASAASEQADLRGWTTLPAQITATRVWVPAGEHEVEIEYLGPNGQKLGRTDRISTTLSPGERRIVSVRTFQ